MRPLHSTLLSDERYFCTRRCRVYTCIQIFLYLFFLIWVSAFFRHRQCLSIFLAIPFILHFFAAWLARLSRLHSDVEKCAGSRLSVSRSLDHYTYILRLLLSRVPRDDAGTSGRTYCLACASASYFHERIVRLRGLCMIISRNGEARRCKKRKIETSDEGQQEFFVAVTYLTGLCRSDELYIVPWIRFVHFEHFSDPAVPRNNFTIFWLSW